MTDGLGASQQIKNAAHQWSLARRCLAVIVAGQGAAKIAALRMGFEPEQAYQFFYGHGMLAHDLGFIANNGAQMFGPEHVKFSGEMTGMDGGGAKVVARQLHTGANIQKRCEGFHADNTQH